MELSTGKMIERLKRGFHGIIMGYSLIASGYLLHSYGKLFFLLDDLCFFLPCKHGDVPKLREK
jgi:hypothetical protein